jgi:iron(II)-dependent oxidoreductase
VSLLLGLALLLTTFALPDRVRADGLMLVAAGAFWMGRDGGPPDEQPAHRVFVRDFWMDRHKVTNAEFAAFLEARGPTAAGGERRFDADDADARIHRAGGRWVADAGYEHHPAVEVSWFGARDYCAWKGRRLPTEAEWEKAARGDDRRPYPWGWAAPTAERAIFGRAFNATAPTEGRPAGRSPYGVEDLLGNLREWTATVFRPYPYRSDDGRFTGREQPVVGVRSRRADAKLQAERARGEPVVDVRSRRADAEPQAERARGEPVVDVRSRRADAEPQAKRARGEPERVVLRGASHDDPAEALSVTRRHSYDRRGAGAGHHHVGFRCATSEDLGGY